MKLNEARKLREIIHTAAISLPDKEASQGAVLFPRLKGKGALVPAGTRINWKGVVKRAAVDLWDTPENTPDMAPDLWEDIGYKEGYRIIPNVITTGLAFSTCERGWWEGELYESLLDNNVWTPAAFSEGWKKVN